MLIYFSYYLRCSTLFFTNPTEERNRHFNWVGAITWIDMAPAMPKVNSKPAPRSTSKKKYASKFLQAWVGDLHWISRSDRGLSHAFCRICNSQRCCMRTAWGRVRSTSTGSHRFATLCPVVLPLVPLPYSNPDSERVFSMVKKIDTDSRFDLGQDTACALLSKLNTEDSCFKFQPSDELLKCAKSTT